MPWKKGLPAALLLVLLWTAWRLVALKHAGIPAPAIHDEFSYLLGADTFAHGRLANPPHALAEFFESPHVLVRPVYASKYPPGQALFLALGQRLFGSPFYGVMLGDALMLFSFCVMLFAWVPYPWALAASGAVLLGLRTTTEWSSSYWGGAVAASGGALVLLGIGIYRGKQRPLAGVIFALGALLLFWTRPFEGGVFTLLVLAAFAKELWRRRGVGALLAALLVFALGGAWTCYDNQAVTGHPFLLPYLLHDRQYNVTPVFWFLPLRPEPVYSHPRLESQHGTNGWEASVYRADQPWWRGLSTGLISSLEILGLSLGAPVLFTLLVPVAWRDPLYRKMVIVSGVFILALAVETFHYEHYAAPVFAALALMVAVWAEYAWKLKTGRLRVGAALVVLALLSTANSSLLFHVSHWLRITPGTSASGSASSGGHTAFAGDWAQRRAALIHRLSALDRRQLVIVRYPSPDWNPLEEWVYNSADLDSQRVVFAHDLGVEKNRALLAYYPDREVSLVTFDGESGEDLIQPYPVMQR